MECSGENSKSVDEGIVGLADLVGLASLAGVVDFAVGFAGNVRVSDCLTVWMSVDGWGKRQGT